jgi:hypothetical protein
MIHDSEQMKISLLLCQLSLLRFSPLNSIKHADVVCDWISALLTMAVTFNDADHWYTAATEVCYIEYILVHT